jgi:uncharacterized Tic20 family protein
MTQTFGAVPDANEIKPDERMISLFAHLSLFLGGIILPIIFWATNKDKSKFVTFHSLQSLWFHIAYIAVIIVLALVMVFVVIIFGVGMGAMMGSGGGNEMPVFLIIAMIAFYAALFAVIFGAIGYSIYMGIKAYQGKLVKYPFIGNMVYKKVYGTV